MTVSRLLSYARRETRRKMHYRLLALSCLLSLMVSACNSVALSVDDLSELELVPALPFILADTDQIELRLFAPDIPESLRMSVSDVAPAILEPSLSPFTLIGQRFDNDFEVTLVLSLPTPGSPGQVVDLYFVLLNAYGSFDVHTVVEFY